MYQYFYFDSKIEDPFIELISIMSLFLGIVCPLTRRKEGNYLFNDARFIYRYMASVMVNDHSDSERGNLPPPHGLLFPISSKGSFICIIPQTG